MSSILFLLFEWFTAALRFAYFCFLQPLGKAANQQERLDHFYQGQSQVYDATRNWLLKGRTDMLKLCAGAFFKRPASDSAPVWVDMGGGTGWNVEQMDRFMSVGAFKAVYIVDLCEPLLEVARRRVAEKGWKNVYCVCADAATWRAPGKADLVTFSYSLSMIPSFYATLDSVQSYLGPQGTVAVCDFYISERCRNTSAAAGVNYHCGWMSRLFWLHWFEMDHIDLHHTRRQYLEYKFDSRKSYSARNTIIPTLFEIPYYIFIGEHRAAKAEKQAVTPTSDVRLPYDLVPDHKEFRSWIYGFTWEDPAVDMEAFKCGPNETIFCITSAGCNALHYAIAAEHKPKRIHCVDLNPAQGHILELKLAAIAALRHEDVWQMFGAGKHEDFPTLLDTKLSPYLSSPAYEFWKDNSSAFSSAFYLRGYSGHALRLVKWTLKLCGVEEAATALANANTLDEQQAVWDAEIKPILLSKACQRIFESPAFMWNALGVPRNQARMLQKETNVRQYAEDTLQPITSSMHLKSQNYHYYLALKQRYHSPDNAPAYLSKKGYEVLRQNECALMDTFRIHTDSILNALRKCDEGELTIWVGMDHMDWYDPVCRQTAKKYDGQEDWSDLRLTVKALRRALRPGGRAFWRSAAQNPWYAKLFEQYGFNVHRLSVREIGATQPIDRVNMYASFWVATNGTTGA